MDAKLDPVFQKATAGNALPGIAAAIIDSKGNRLYQKGFGVNDIGASSPTQTTTSTPLLMWSCTKLITSIAALQLLEQGKLSLDDPASKYVPDISKIQVIDGKDADGKLKTRPQTTEITIRHLFTHSSGFTYDFFDVNTIQMRIQNNEQPCGYMANAEWYNFKSPLKFDAGTAFEYGISIDWLGFIIEAISGLRLPEYFEKHILTPLGMPNTAAHFKSDQARLLVHTRGESGKDALTSQAEMAPGENPPLYGGGHVLVSTIDDYTTLLAALLNKGASPTNGARILSAETVATYLFQDQLPPAVDRKDIGAINTPTVPMLSNAGALLPHVAAKGWSCGLMLNKADVPGGRKQGSGAWAGMGNVYYWVDPASGLAGMIGTSILPFLEEGVLSLFESLERVAYGGDAERAADGTAMYRVGA